MPSASFLPVDAISGARKIISPVYEAIHSQLHFTANHYVTVGTATAVTVLITPPAASEDKYIHLTAEFNSNNSGVFQWCENPVATGGTVLESYNNYRGSVVVDPVTLKHSVTVDAASVGSVMRTFIVQGATTNQTQMGGGESHENEWILDPTKSYLARFEADNATTRVVINVYYYYRSGAE